MRFRPRDHPRIRGEHARFPIAAKPDNGSSPHTRGAPQARLRRGFRPRIIPAYAGSTIVVTTHIERHQDHPRIRGEHEANSLDGQTMAGSSPHTRGARLPFRASPRRLRIIPAYAGSTRTRGDAGSQTPDHPRIRGEHALIPLAILAGLGSSPHTRGALERRIVRPLMVRIIPAYAGSTGSTSPCGS